MMPDSTLTEDELRAIEQRCTNATSGPWFVRHLDDENAMNLIAISTAEDTGRRERWPDFDHGEVVAATLVQQPRYIDVADGKWEANAAFIANARSDVPRLIAEIRRLRHEQT